MTLAPKGVILLKFLDIAELKKMTQEKRLPILPKATAIWLIENTGLTFRQIGDFCGIHELEIKAMADGEAAVGVVGVNPVAGGQLSAEEIEKCTKNPEARLNLIMDVAYKLACAGKKQPKYVPMARRQDKPDAVYWILKNCPGVKDKDIVKLVGTTKSTIEAIRDRSHWNIKNIRPRDPILLGLCSQTELDRVIERSGGFGGGLSEKKEGFDSEI